jgi:hypothetical protein
MIKFKKLIQLVKNKIRGAPKENDEILNKDTSIHNSININSKNPKIMTMFNYGVGGNEAKVDANEAIQEIQENKTLLVSKLTTEDTVSPEIVKGLKTVEDVFKHYKPSVSVEHETADGETVSEEFTFNNLGDFTPKSLIQNSDFLKNLSLEQDQYNNIIRQLRNNKVLNNMLSNPQAKAEFIEALRSVASELENNNQK